MKGQNTTKSGTRGLRKIFRCWWNKSGQVRTITEEWNTNGGNGTQRNRVSDGVMSGVRVRRSPTDKHHYHCFPQPPSWSVRIILPPVTCFPIWGGEWIEETDEVPLFASQSWQTASSDWIRYSKTQENKLIGNKDSSCMERETKRSLTSKWSFILERRSVQVTMGSDVIANALFPWVLLHHEDEWGLPFVNHVV